MIAASISATRLVFSSEIPPMIICEPTRTTPYSAPSRMEAMACSVLRARLDILDFGSVD